MYASILACAWQNDFLMVSCQKNPEFALLPQERESMPQDLFLMHKLSFKFNLFISDGAYLNVKSFSYNLGFRVQVTDSFQLFMKEGKQLCVY